MGAELVISYSGDAEEIALLDGYNMRMLGQNGQRQRASRSAAVAPCPIV